MSRFTINIKGDLFATVVGFGTQAVTKLISSVILTRILAPSAYGIIAIILSIAYVLELVADLNVDIFVIRDVKGEEPRYLNTAWTIRLTRSVINTAILFVSAPLIATHFYHAPALATPLRAFSFSFLIGGMASMAYVISIRRKRARLITYTDLFSTVISTAFSIIYCYYSRDFWGLIYGILLNRCIFAATSYMHYRELRPRFAFDRRAAREILQFTKYTMPSSLVTIGLNQFDKFALLRWFDLPTLGIYGLAGNISGPIDALIGTTSQRVLYPRCAANYRENPSTFTQRYYSENVKLFALILFLAAALAGGAPLVIAALYDYRYAGAAVVLQAFGLRSILVALQGPAEDLLIAAGEYQVTLYTNIVKAIWIVVASYLGYRYFGLIGFVYGVATYGLAGLVYLWSRQFKKGMIILKYEALKLLFSGCVFAAALTFSNVVLAHFHVTKISLH